MSGCKLELSLVHELSDLHIVYMHLSEIYLLYNKKQSNFMAFIEEGRWMKSFFANNLQDAVTGVACSFNIEEKVRR